VPWKANPKGPPIISLFWGRTYPEMQGSFYASPPRGHCVCVELMDLFVRVAGLQGNAVEEAPEEMPVFRPAL